ncbi:MAG: hypothetical protein NW214_04150 [Pseudanabaenaceae cyanobacterium bins.39]|nr:hypothetical protein [Pseudanabaenaceae cyanobacterium bins.39]
MIKTIGITAAISLAIGSIGGYWLQKMESQPMANKNDEAIAANVKPIQVDLRQTPKRSELLLKYSLCANKQPDEKIKALSDKDLNDLVYQVCVQAS